MEDFKDPIMPPEGHEAGGRYESSDIDIEKFHEYLSSTLFENREAIRDVLTGEYKMTEREDADLLKANMTRVFQISELGKEGYFGTPLSGREPQAVLRTRMKTGDGGVFDLTIFKIFNRNDYFRHEYVLTPVEELDEAI